MGKNSGEFGWKVLLYKLMVLVMKFEEKEIYIWMVDISLLSLRMAINMP
jgi:hypothetical protein